jgi:hypothetical protein
MVVSGDEQRDSVNFKDPQPKLDSKHVIPAVSDSTLDKKAHEKEKDHIVAGDNGEKVGGVAPLDDDKDGGGREDDDVPRKQENGKSKSKPSTALQDQTNLLPTRQVIMVRCRNSTHSASPPRLPLPPQPKESHTQSWVTTLKTGVPGSSTIHPTLLPGPNDRRSRDSQNLERDRRRVPVELDRDCLSRHFYGVHADIWEDQRYIWTEDCHDGLFGRVLGAFVSSLSCRGANKLMPVVP